MRVYENRSIQLQYLKESLNIFEKNSLNLAKQIYIWYDLELFKNIDGRIYADIYEFAKKELDIERKTVNAYIDVVHVYFDMKVDIVEEQLIEKAISDIDFVLKDDTYDYFSFSQLRACMKLNADEVKKLEIDFATPVCEIERKKKEYFKEINKNVVSEKETEKNETKDIMESEAFTSLNDIKKNIDIIKSNFIPDNSEFEILFRNEKTLFKGKKKEYNNVTALKIMRQMLENNSENEFYYAVVKIKKPL